MKLVSDWREGWTWLSTNFLALEMAWITAWNHFEKAIESTIGESTAMTIAFVIAMLGFVGRFIAQRSKHDDVADES